MSRKVRRGRSGVDQTPIADCHSRAFCIEVLVLIMAETLSRLGELSSFAALRSGDVLTKRPERPMRSLEPEKRAAAVRDMHY